MSVKASFAQIKENIENFNLPVFITDSEGKYLSGNGSFVNLLKFSPAEFSAEKFHHVLRGKEKLNFYHMHLKKLSELPVYNFKMSFFPRTGNEIICYVSSAVIRSKSGKPLFYIFYLSDVKESQNTLHQKLSDNEIRFKISQDHADFGAWDWDIESDYLWWSEKVGQLFGNEQKSFETTFNHFVKCIHPHDRGIVLESVRNAVKLNKKFDVVFRCTTDKGEERWLRESGEVLRDSNGKAMRMVGVVQDVSRRRKFEEFADHKNKLLELLYGGLSAFLENQEFDAVARSLLEGLMNLCESEMGFIGSVDFDSEERPLIEIHAQSCRAEDNERGIEDFHRIKHKKGYFNDSLIGETMAQKDPLIYKEQDLYNKDLGLYCDNEIKMTHFAGIPIFRNNILTGIYALVNSKSEFAEEMIDLLKPFNAALSILFHSNRMNQSEKSNRSILQNAKTIAEKANRAKTTFLANVSHELRNPLNAVLGYAQLLEYEKDKSKQVSDFSSQILKSGKQLLGLVDDLLQLISIEEESISPSMEDISVFKIVHDVVTTLKIDTKNRNIEIVYSSIDDSLFVKADRLFLKDILQNLLSNAVLYNKHDGMVFVEAEYLEDSRMIRIMVRDTGQGIDLDKQNLIFIPFERLGREMSAIPGTGIGLFIAKRLVEMQSGYIDFESIAGEGSRFWVDLPVSHVMMERYKELSQKTFEESLDLNILYIEDEELYHKLFASIFQKFPNCKLTSVLTGREGLVLARSIKPDIIFLDIVLPDINGFEVLAHIKSDESLKDVLIVGISAHFSKEDMNAALKAGFYDIMTKPLPSENIVPILKKAAFMKSMNA